MIGSRLRGYKQFTKYKYTDTVAFAKTDLFQGPGVELGILKRDLTRRHRELRVASLPLGVLRLHPVRRREIAHQATHLVRRKRGRSPTPRGEGKRHRSPSFLAICSPAAARRRIKTTF